MQARWENMAWPVTACSGSGIVAPDCLYDSPDRARDHLGLVDRDNVTALLRGD
jgi:hypothetical protein